MVHKRGFKFLLGISRIHIIACRNIFSFTISADVIFKCGDSTETSCRRCGSSDIYIYMYIVDIPKHRGNLTRIFIK